MNPVVIDVSRGNLTAIQLARRICKEDKVPHTTLLAFVKINK